MTKGKKKAVEGEMTLIVAIKGNARREEKPTLVITKEEKTAISNAGEFDTFIGSNESNGATEKKSDTKHNE